VVFFFQNIDINKEYGNYNITTRQSLEAWSAAELDLSLVSTVHFFFIIEMHLLIPQVAGSHFFCIILVATLASHM
jgi:hypothetical protein